MSKPTPEDMSKPSFRKFDLDINLEIVAIPADLPGETARLLIETAHFFGIDPTNITTKDSDQIAEGDEGASSELLRSGSYSSGSEMWDVRRAVTWDSQFVAMGAAAQMQVESQHKRPSAMNEAALRQVTSTPLVVQVACVGGCSDLLHISIFITYSLHICIFIAYFLIIIGEGLCIFIACLLHIYCIFNCCYWGGAMHMYCILIAYLLRVSCIFIAYLLRISSVFITYLLPI